MQQIYTNRQKLKGNYCKSILGLVKCGDENKI